MNMARIGNLLDRPKLYYNVDGVGELGIGFMLLGYSLLGWLQVHTPKDSAWNQIYTMFIYLGVMFSIIHHGSKAIKKHITYPRTGLVEYRRSDTFWRPAIIGFTVATTASIALVAAIRSHWNITTPVSLIGLLFAASYARGFARTVRWKWAVVAVMVAGSLVLAFLPADLVGAVADHSWVTAKLPSAAVGGFLFSFILYGALLLVSGGISFWLYLEHTQPAARET